MVSGPDVITYIGVPLAVLGVLPIIFNTITTFATVSKVRRILHHCRLHGIVRGDLINKVIEVELPRYTIAPLHREEQGKDYWTLSDFPSPIPGGSWTTFNWKRHNTGIKTQRIDYSDQLKQPQAEIGFEELISFLLDLGAIPDPAGFRMLKGSGLWVPTGTPLLLSPDRHEPVLTIAPLDESDGNLSLAVHWSSNWGMRDQNSLPPYWVLVEGLAPGRPTTSTTKTDDVLDLGSGPSIDTKRPSLAVKIPVEECPPSIKCQIGINGLITAVPDDFDGQLSDHLSITHLTMDELTTNSTGVWFASAITALGTTSSTILWNYKIPSSILSFAKKDSIPCGILVLLDIVPEDATPEWATAYPNDVEEERERTFKKMRDNSAAMMRENLLPPAQKAAAVWDRQLMQHHDFVDNINAKRRQDDQRAETRMIEAIQSPQWDNKLIASHSLCWLKKNGEVEEEHDLRRAVEVLLWRMVNDAVFAGELGGVLDEWKKLDDNGGLRRADYMGLKEKKVLFAMASLMLSVIRESVTAPHGGLAMDLQECLRIWKKVRLG